MRRDTFGIIRKRWNLLAWLSVAAISLISIGGYAMLSITLNGIPPSSRSFNGMAFVAQPSSESTADQVWLYVFSNAAGDHPSVTYAILACGPRPYSGALVLLGNALLTNVHLYDASMQKFSDNVNTKYQSVNGAKPFYADSGQIIRFGLPAISCRELNAEQGLQGPAEASGNVLAPLQESWSGPWGLWHGPHSTQSWPEVGADQHLWQTKFTMVGTPGIWTFPSTENVNVTADGFSNPDWSVDASEPSPSTSGTTTWSSSALAISPTAQLTNTASVALLQDWIVIFAISFGIGGAMLASLFFELIRPGKRQDSVPVQWNQGVISNQVGARQQSARFGLWFVLIGTAVIFRCVRGRRRLHKSQ